MASDSQQPGSPQPERGERPGLSPDAALRQRGGHSPELDPDAEEDLWQGRTSWKHFTDLILVAGGWSLAAAFVWFQASPKTSAAIGWVAFGVSALGWFYVLGRILFAMLNYRYRLTTQRIFIEKGILGRTIDQTELIRVDDLRIHKSFLNRVMGLGTVEIFSTDASDRRVLILGIENPEELADSVRERMRRLRQRSLFVESL